jgi:hypothetical protein
MSAVVRRVAVAATAAVVGITAFPQAALAAGSSRSCAGVSCSVQVTNFPGGVISVDADVSGANPQVGQWKLWKTGSSAFTCVQSSFPASGGVRSWTCSAPRGNYTAQVWGPGPTKIGIRW